MNDPVIKITFQAHESDREYLRIVAAKARCSQSEFLRKLLHNYSETQVAVMRQEQSFTGVPNELEDLSVGYR